MPGERDTRDRDYIETAAYWEGCYDAVEKIMKILRAFQLAPTIMFQSAKEILEEEEKIYKKIKKSLNEIKRK